MQMHISFFSQNFPPLPPQIPPNPKFICTFLYFPLSKFHLTMAETKPTSQITSNVSEQHLKQTNPFTSFLENLHHIFPFPNFQSDTNEGGVVEKPSNEAAQGEARKPGIVRFKDARPAVPPPLKLEPEEVGSEHNPAVLWQVYAFGGFVIAKWLWAKWNEMKVKNNNSDEDPPNRAENGHG